MITIVIIINFAISIIFIIVATTTINAITFQINIITITFKFYLGVKVSKETLTKIRA